MTQTQRDYPAGVGDAGLIQGCLAGETDTRELPSAS